MLPCKISKMEILLNGKPQFTTNTDTTVGQLKQDIENQLGLESTEYHLISNGKRLNENNELDFSRVHIVLNVNGGKGGFGSMLRAIGAQIEKTTNREACRDLSGRRLRDINEEQRLKNWINQQVEREKEAKERKKKKLERLCEMPKHEFKDDQYDKERSELPEIVEDAVLRGLQASCSTKRKAIDKNPVVKKKAKLWVDDDLEDDLSCSESENEESDSDENKKSTVIPKTSESEDSSSSHAAGEPKNDIENCTASCESTKSGVMDNVDNSNLKNGEHESGEESSNGIREKNGDTQGEGSSECESPQDKEK